jgi:DNA-binding NtrC family response regulator
VVASPVKTPSILLVDDDSDLLQFVTTMLARYGYNVLPADNPESALNIHNQRKGEIGLLLTDVIMPGMNGPDLAQAVLRRDPDIKILFMSGYKVDRLARFGDILSGYEVLGKPFTPAELLQAVNSMVGGNR